MRKPKVIGLIPARAGSKRVPDKNIRRVGGHPLIAYSICSALDSGVFDSVVVSTDSELYADIARYYGATVPFLRPESFAGATSPDIDWIEHTLDRLAEAKQIFDAFSILRPTSPFRQPDTIRRAWDLFSTEAGVDSLRAVEKCTQHPAKMWIVRGKRMFPLLPFGPVEQPWHSSQYPTLPLVHVQNASLEIAWTRVIREERTIAGNVVVPFITEDLEGFDINDPYDWHHMEFLLGSGAVKLPSINKKPYPSS